MTQSNLNLDVCCIRFVERKQKKIKNKHLILRKLQQYKP